MRRSTKYYLKQLLGFSEGSEPFIYLGTPLFRGQPRVRHFQSLVDNAISKFSRWKGSSLSMAGRINNVNTVISSSLVHNLKIYCWPISCLKILERAINKKTIGSCELE